MRRLRNDHYQHLDYLQFHIGDVIGKLVAEDEDAGDTHDFFMVRGTDYFEIINDTHFSLY